MYRSTFNYFIITTIVLFFSGASITKTYAGSVLLSKRISVEVQNKSVEQILHIVEDKANVLFMYNPRMFNAKRKIALQLKNTTVQEILQFAINNKELVFYELGNYIVITSKREAPKQAQVFLAAPPPPKIPTTTEQTHKIIYDTVKVFDTVVVIDTNRIWVRDTIKVKVFDTISKQAKHTAQGSTPSVLISTVGNRTFFSEFSFVPQYSDIMPSTNWLAELSLEPRASVGCKWDNVAISIGVGALWQRGRTITKETTTVLDSTLYLDTLQVIQRYKKGDYWYLRGTDTIHQIVYDSTLITVPRSWYKTTQRQSTSEWSVGYSIFWLTIPCKMSYEWSYSRKTSIGIGLNISSSFALKKEGSIFDEAQNRIVPISSIGLQGFALMVSIEPSVLYEFTPNISFLFTPILKASANSLFPQSAYYFAGGVNFGLRKYF